MKKGFYASEKNIIGIREYMDTFLNVTYKWHGKLTHKKLVEYFNEKGYELPRRAFFDDLMKEDILSGKVHLVKDEVGRIIPYKNKSFDIEYLLNECNKQKKLLEERRNKILREQGLRETISGNIVRFNNVDPEEYAGLTTGNLGSLLSNNNKVKKLVNKRKKY